MEPVLKIAHIGLHETDELVNVGLGMVAHRALAVYGSVGRAAPQLSSSPTKMKEMLRHTERELIVVTGPNLWSLTFLEGKSWTDYKDEIENAIVGAVFQMEPRRSLDRFLRMSARQIGRVERRLGNSSS